MLIKPPNITLEQRQTLLQYSQLVQKALDAIIDYTSNPIGIGHLALASYQTLLTELTIEISSDLKPQ